MILNLDFGGAILQVEARHGLVEFSVDFRRGGGPRFEVGMDADAALLLASALEKAIGDLRRRP